MRTIVGLTGATLVGSLGWWLGEYAGLMTAVVLGSVGSGVGLYAGRRLIDNLLE